MVRFLYDQRCYEIKEKLLNGQTLFIQFQEMEDSKDCRNYNICLGIYNKRKHAVRNEEEVRITGKSPFLNVYKAIKMFDEIEQYVLDECREREENVRFWVGWVDNRRRDAYYKVLSKRGYDYQTMWGKKQLIKRVDYAHTACE